MRVARKPTALAITSVAALAIGVPAAHAATSGAASPSSSPSSAATHPQAAKLAARCAKLPTALQKVQQHQTRLDADASTHGSIAWVQARVNRLQASGKHPQRLTIAEDLLNARTAEGQVVAARLKLLDDLQAVCAALPSTGSSNS